MNGVLGGKQLCCVPLGEEGAVKTACGLNPGGRYASLTSFAFDYKSKVCKTRFPLLVLFPQILRRYRFATFKHLRWRAGKDNFTACFSSVRAYVDYVV